MFNASDLIFGIPGLFFIIGRNYKLKNGAKNFRRLGLNSGAVKVRAEFHTAKEAFDTSDASFTVSYTFQTLSLLDPAVTGWLEAGVYPITWQAADKPTGTYIIRFCAGSYT